MVEFRHALIGRKQRNLRRLPCDQQDEQASRLVRDDHLATQRLPTGVNAIEVHSAYEFVAVIVATVEVDLTQSRLHSTHVDCTYSSTRDVEHLELHCGVRRESHVDLRSRRKRIREVGRHRYSKRRQSIFDAGYYRSAGTHP